MLRLGAMETILALVAQMGVAVSWNKSDMELKDGGLPAGAKAEIIVQNLQKLKNMDEAMSYIDTIEEYVEWQNSYQVGFDTDMQGECQKENIKIDEMDAIKKICNNPIEESVGKYRKVQLLSPDGNYIFLIQYLGREPYYSNNIDKFEDMYRSFNFYNF